ncbi:hypothetical protein V7659_17230 [Neobacillus drentensis]|uniref:hypothetical protein n=1 Tax=Neobacillus drentensis TaxID=220684 RepID=UPI002FFD5B4C
MSNVKVFTYMSPNDPVIQEVCSQDNILHICATTSLTGAMVNCFGEKGNVISAKWFTDAVLGDWMAPSVKFKQFMYLSELVRKGSIDNPGDSAAKQALRRNKADVLLTIRMLAELGIIPADLRESARTRYERELSLVWEQLEKKDQQEKYFKSFTRLKTFHQALKRPYVFKNMVNARLLEKYSKDKESGIGVRVHPENLHINQTVVLHGFYFLTPIQQLIFQALKQAETDIVFLQFYNPKYIHTFSFLKDVLGEDNGWASADQWNISMFNDERSDGIADYLASHFEERVQDGKSNSNRINQTGYSHLYKWMQDFKKDTIEKEKDEKDLSVNHLTAAGERIQQRLQEFFPEEHLSKRSFLSYPIGQYLLHLHKIWNQETKQQQVDIITLQECFLSPWLYVEDQVTGERKNASEFLHDLQRLADFFPRSMAMQEWITHLEQLIGNIQEGPFLAREFDVLPNQTRFIDEIKNPLKKIGPYSIESADLKDIKKILQLMNSHIELLFQKDNEYFTLPEYFSLLQEIMNGSLNMQDLQDHEEELIKKLTEVYQYNQNRPAERSYHIEDISEAVHCLLASSLDEPEDKEIRLQRKLIRLRSFAEIDGVIFDSKDIHVSGLDDFSFPNPSSPLPWPLTIKTAEHLCLKTPHMKAMLLRENHKEVIPRYLFFVLLSGTQHITLSWFKEWGGKQGLGPSIYLKLVEGVCTASSEACAVKIQVPDESSEFLKDNTAVYGQELNHYSDYALSELNLCKRRFFYSYVVQPYSVYRSDFHFGFLHSSLYKLVSQFSTDPALMMKQVFPHWTDFKREAKIASAVRFNRPSVLSETFEYAEMEYQALSGLKYLVNPANSSEGWKRAWKNEGYRLTDSHFDLLKADPGPNCKYCPHEEFCPAAQYAVDDE